MQRGEVSRPVYLGRKFDFVQSFYVKKSGQSDFEDIFFSNLASHATTGIVLSYGWSAVGQLENHGFKYNKEVSENIRSQFNNAFKSSIMFFDKASQE